MTISRHNPESTSFRRGFSLVEILVTCALLSVIILGLVAMFNQTRKAFTSSITQVDVLEAGRAAADLVGREMEQMAAANTTISAPNFFVDTPQNVPTFSPVRQPLVDPSDIHTNNIQEVYFLTRYNQQWNIVGYKVFFPAGVASVGLGSLYRFNSNNISSTNLGTAMNLVTSPFFVFTNTTGEIFAKTNGFNHVMDGVVDFRIRVYDTNGNVFTNTTVTGPTNVVTVIPNNSPIGDYNYKFYGNSLPGYVEIELGVVEDRTLARYQALASTNADSSGSLGLAYLRNHPGQVHIFRQRIPIRNVNSAAYQ